MIPIFIITCDRLEILKKSMKSYYACIKTLFDIAIVDFGTTYTPTVDFLKQLARDGIKVYWKGRINHETQLNKANECIQNYFRSHPKSNYVVTDPDIALDNTQGDVLEFYSFLLETFPNISVAGPMLRIDDIPVHYPLREKLITGKMGMHKGFHSQPIHTIVYRDDAMRYINAPIDTTFGMYRAGTQWARLKNGIRALAPYGARHLDWYINPRSLTLDQAYYMKHASKQIVSWSKIGG